MVIFILVVVLVLAIIIGVIEDPLCGLLRRPHHIV